MAWIKMRTDLWDDPRVAAICDQTGESETTIVGALYRLWSIADQHTEDGRLPAMTAKTLDRKTGVPGFSTAMVQVGWLVEDEAYLLVPRFDEHNGKSAKKRLETAKRQQKRRDSKVENTTSHEDVTPASDECHAVVTQSCDESVTGASPREEEDKSKSKNKTLRRTILFDPDDLEIAKEMLEQIQVVSPGYKQPNLENWANTIRLMREQDGRDPPEIRELFSWANQDSFWKSVILSPKKFREKWATLSARMHGSRSSPAVASSQPGLDQWMEQQHDT